jgi:thermitase
VKKKQFIIGLKKGFSEGRALVEECDAEASLVCEIGKINACVCKVPKKKVPSFLKFMKSNPNVIYIEEDNIVRVAQWENVISKNKTGANAAIPNDPLFPEQWGIPQVNGPRAWDLSNISTATAFIAILDTGIDLDHQDLSDKVVINQNFTDSNTTDDIYGHGTHVAGIAAAITDNMTGVAGMSFNSAQLMNIKVLGDNGSGFHSWIAQGVIFATDQGAKVINMSLGGPSPSSILRNAILYARDNGAVVIAAAGNSNSKRRQFPAGYNYPISVAATNRRDKKARFSNFGARWVDVAAPGVGILSTCPNHPNVIGCFEYGSLNGTSMATPFVSGLAALLFATYPSLTNLQVSKIIKKTCKDIKGTGNLYRFGRINALRAIRRAGNVSQTIALE